ncbi:MAG: HAD-IIIA family hydrolase [Oligoflexia bacterium]|nr:HAD-IIIA family hydrolase [Oligoflexia bacterium]
MRSPSPAIFFDKDGVLVPDEGTLLPQSEFVLEEMVELLSRLRCSGVWKLFVVTNQAVIARGLITPQELQQYFTRLQSTILKRSAHAYFDKIYYCPHHPHANLPEYRVLCECRKPKAGMLTMAAEEFNLDLKRSYLLGDRVSDVVAANLVGCKAILCRFDFGTKRVVSPEELMKMVVTDLSEREEKDKRAFATIETPLQLLKYL